MSQGRQRAHAAGAAHPDALAKGGGISNKSIRNIMRQRHTALEVTSDEEEADKNLAAKIKARQQSLRQQNSRDQSSTRSFMSGDGMDEESDNSLFSSSSDEEEDGRGEADEGYKTNKRPSIRNMSRKSFFNRAQVDTQLLDESLKPEAAPTPNRVATCNPGSITGPKSNTQP